MYVTIVWLGLFVGHLTVGSVPVPNTLTDFWDPISHAGLPCPAFMRKEELSPITS